MKRNWKALITMCISKIGNIETVETVLNFDEENWLGFLSERSFIEETLKDKILPNKWYFVASYNIEPAVIRCWKFDYLLVFVLKRKI